jgi:hypothetical protein
MTVSTQLVSFGFLLTLEIDILISGGYFQDVSINANNVLVMGGHWVDAHLNGKHSPCFRFSTLGLSFLTHISLSIRSPVQHCNIHHFFSNGASHVYAFRLPFHLVSFRSSFDFCFSTKPFKTEILIMHCNLIKKELETLH